LALRAQQGFYLRNNDTVVFYGDSITEQRLYTTFVETFVLTRYPRLQVRFVNAGWGGENAPGGNGGPVDLRLRRDVIPFKPTVMTVMLGMNDGGYRAFDQERFDRYTAGMEHILQVTASENTTVTGLAVNQSLSWSQLDGALPLALNLRDLAVPIAARRGAATLDLALRSSDFTQALNRQMLRVRGLAGASYALKINGSAVGSFSREQLEKGLNLATLATPMARQAQTVFLLTVKRGDVREKRWKEIQVPYGEDNLNGLPAALEGLDAMEAELAQRQRAAAQPAACFYELIPE